MEGQLIELHYTVSRCMVFWGNDAVRASFSIRDNRKVVDDGDDKVITERMATSGPLRRTAVYIPAH